MSLTSERGSTRLLGTNTASHSAVAQGKGGTDKTDYTLGLCAGRGQPEGHDRPLAAFVNSYKESLAKHGSLHAVGQSCKVAIHSVYGKRDSDGKRAQYNGDPGAVVRQSGGSVEGPGCSKGCGLHDTGTAVIDAEARPVTVCGSWAILSECSTGLHHFGKRILCGQEWCPDCGRKGSATHKRRQARLLPKVQQISKLGYFVVEMPDLLRKVGKAGVNPDIDNLAAFVCPDCDGIAFWLSGGGKVCVRCHPPGGDVPIHEGGDGRIEGWAYSKEALKATTNTIVDILAGKRGEGGRGRKRSGGFFTRGLARWHWFGDICKHEKRVLNHVTCQLNGKRCVLRTKPRAKTCPEFVNNGKWNPHLNVLVDVGSATFEHYGTGRIPSDVLKQIKVALRAALNCPDLIVHYSYKSCPGQMVQTVEYVTRPTFTNRAWNEYMANELFNFRNQRWWGKWKDDKAWELEEAEHKGVDVDGLEVIERIASGICPDCGSPLRTLCHNARGDPVQWTRAVDATYLTIWRAQEIAGTGYYRIPHEEWHGPDVSPAKLMVLAEMEARARANPSVHPFARAMRQSVDDLWVKTRTYQGMKRAERIRFDGDEAWWDELINDCHLAVPDGIDGDSKVEQTKQQEVQHGNNEK